MNRITRSTMRRLPPRTTVISGAALGLIAGAAVYGAVSSSAEATTHTAFKAKAPVAAAHASAADCAATAKLEKGVCVVHVVRTVVAPPSAASIAAHAKAAHAAGAKSSAISKKAAARHAALLKAEKAEASSRHTESREGSEGESEDGWMGTTTPTPAVVAPAPVPAKAPVPTPVAVATATPTATPVPTAAS